VWVDVEVRLAGDLLRVDVAVVGAGAGVRGAAPVTLDRVVAVGGRVDVVDGRLRAVLPCG
jgi:hypothetical protein